ncbi:MAG: DUF1292 domain-containing protein [Parasporobacterium sp.]|nr:DUF1292 domain-containing protein [Parasporobacterium sp.]
MEENKIRLTDEDGTVEEFYVIDETKVNDVNYLLVCESMEDETEAYILKDLSKPEDPESVYEFVDDDTELEAVADLFAQLLEDEDLV